MKTVLLTGASGFVGANLVRRLLAEGHQVHVLVRGHSNLWRLEDVLPHLRLYEVDLRQADAVAEAVQFIQPEWVFHLAVYGAYPTQQDALPIMATNVMGTAHLIEACLAAGSVQAIVNTGSSSEYGLKTDPHQEAMPLDPNSYYAVGKASATLYCRYVSLAHQLPITTLRLYSVYGEYEEPTRLMPTLISQGLRGLLPPLVSPQTARDFIYVDDVVAAYLTVIQAEALPLGTILNIGSGQQRTIGEVVSVAREVMNIQHEPEWGSMPPRIWDHHVWVADMSHTFETLPWRPRYDFKSGFTKMMKWIQDHDHFYPYQA